MNNEDAVVLFHADCPDGMGSHWIARRYLGESAAYIPVFYGKPVPGGLEGKQVYLLDFCYKRDQLKELFRIAKSVVILDHHKSAKEDLDGLELPSNVYVEFDMTRSGAGITRDYFDRGFDHWIVDYIQDRDLWRHQLPDTDAVNGYLDTLPYTFEAFETASKLTAEEAKQLGRGAKAYRDSYIRKCTEHSRMVTFDEHENIPMVNVPYMGISYVVGKLAEGAPFAAAFWVRGDGKVSFSLRSKGDFDVSALAIKHGGGGHKNAAGMTLAFDKAMMLVDGLFA